LALTSPTSDGRLIGIVRSRTKSTENIIFVNEQLKLCFLFCNEYSFSDFRHRINNTKFSVINYDEFSLNCFNVKGSIFIIALSGNILALALLLSNSTKSVSPFSVRLPQLVSESGLSHGNKDEEAGDYRTISRKEG
jgi:hypothetical protein